MAYYPPPPYTPPKGAVVYPTATHTTVVVNPQPVNRVHTSNRGLLGGLMHGLNQAGHAVSKGIDSTANEINKFVDTNWTGPVQDMFNTNNVIQLISRSSGQTLQIVSNATGQLVVDGLGGSGPEAYNACWTVLNEGSNQVRLHNNNNYLAIVNGDTLLINVPPGTPMGVETKLQLASIGAQFVVLGSVKDRGRHIGILANGQLKSALATGTEQHAHFGVKLIHSPYPHPNKPY